MAPTLKNPRLEIKITKAQFRYETEADCKDFNRLLKGYGTWKEVKIPCYHGPQGPSTAWYRAEVEISNQMLELPSLMLHFNGSDYYTDAFINGHHVGYHEGMLDEFEFNISKYAHAGKNILLVKVQNDYSMLGGEGTPRRWGNKLSASNCPGWNDALSGWSCCPTGYGIYQDLSIVAKSSPYITDLFCRPLVDKKAVELWVEIDLENGNDAKDFLLEYNLYGQNFKAVVAHNIRQRVLVVGGRVLHKTLIQIPDSLFRLWSPETPWLYQMQVTMYNADGTKLLDAYKQQFGMRSFVLSNQSRPKGRMYLNGKEIRLRGTNTMGFLQTSVMNHDWNRLTDDLLLAKLTHMNFIRTTQRTMPKEVYEYADRLGIMMQSDLPLFAYINQKQYTEVLKQASGVERLLRNHPSVILLSYLNESMAEVNPHAISRYAYERLFDALDIVVHNENPDRAVKYVDGDYQGPNKGYPDNHCYNIWYDEHGVPLKKLCRGGWMPVSKGWMFGCGEFGAEGLDPVDLMTRRYPAEWLKLNEDGSWNPSKMHGIYSGEQTYGKHWNWFETEYTLQDWVQASQCHQAWGIAKVTRAFRRMPRMNSFAVHLFIDAWPNCWMKAIMDCERTPKLAWYEYRDALTPLSIQVESERTALSSGEAHTFQLWVCNDTDQKDSCMIYYQFEHEGKVINIGEVVADVPDIKRAVAFQGYLSVKMPQVAQRSKVTLRAALYNLKTKAFIHEDASDIIVFPSLPKVNSRVALVGESSDGEELIRSLKIDQFTTVEQLQSKDIIVIAEAPTEEQYFLIKEAVQRGAKAVVLKGAIDSRLLQRKLNYKLLSKKKNSSWVLFRNRKHPWIKNTEKRDLFYPYSSKETSPSRFKILAFDSPDICTLLYYKDALVLGEKNDKCGQWILCGLFLDGMLHSNPSLNTIFYQMTE